MMMCLIWELTVGELSNTLRKKKKEESEEERTFQEEKLEFAKSYDSMNLYLIVQGYLC